jgi:hypothetical protein
MYVFGKSMLRTTKRTVGPRTDDEYHQLDDIQPSLCTLDLKRDSRVPLRNDKQKKVSLNARKSSIGSGFPEALARAIGHTYTHTTVL